MKEHSQHKHRRRQLPTLQYLYLYNNQITDQGLASLQAPPSAGVLPSLERRYLANNQITDEGCAALAATLRGPALRVPTFASLGSPLQ